MKSKVHHLGIGLPLLLLVACHTPVQPGFFGSWQGEAVTSTERTRLLLQIEENSSGENAYLSLPDIGVARWPASSVEGDGAGIKVRIPSDSGPQIMHLSLTPEGLTGSWSESRFPEAAQVKASPVHSTAALPEHRQQIQGPAGTLGASVILPERCSSCPGIVLLHGSGPQPRDSNRFVAQALAQQGIASLFFDKRGVGESDGDFRTASFEDLAEDAIAAAEFLQSQGDIASVGFYGHSQGGWIAPLAALLWPQAAFVITSAGPAVSPAREAQWELVRRLRKEGFPESDISLARQLVEQWHEGIRSNDWEAFEQVADSIEDMPWHEAISHFPAPPDKGFANSYRRYMDFDALAVLTRLTVPMMAILSPDDESIDAVETAEILQGLRDAGADITVRLYPGYDHSLRRLGESGSPLRWPSRPPDLYDSMADFIHAGQEAGGANSALSL